MATTVLRERMGQLLRIHNYSTRTEETYIDLVARFARHFGRSPEQLGSDEIRAYQIWLRNEKHISSSLFNQTAAALRFFYLEVLERPEVVERLVDAKRERKLPVVLSPEELMRFLDSLADLRYRTLLTTIYSAGLRISEALALRAEDIDSSRMLIRIRQGKGHKDRYVPLSPLVLEMLRTWWRAVRPRGLLFAQRRDPLRPMDPATVQGYVRKAAARAGLE